LRDWRGKGGEGFGKMEEVMGRNRKL